MAAKLELDDTLSVATLCQRIDVAEVAVRKVAPETEMLFMEPDVHHADEA